MTQFWTLKVDPIEFRMVCGMQEKRVCPRERVVLYGDKGSLEVVGLGEG